MMKMVQKVRKSISYEKKKSRIGIYFLIPWMIGTVYFFVVPLIEAVIYSFQNIEGKNIGFENYLNAFTIDSVYLPMLLNSIPPMLYQVPIIVVFSLFLAILLNQRFFGRTFARAIFFLPIIIASGIIISILNGDAFSQMLMQNTSSSNLFQSEVLRIMLRELDVSISVVNFITGMVDSLFELLWKSGIQTLLFLASLQTIPPSVYEAAKIEGGTMWENFWKITFPMVSPVILMNIVYSVIDSFSDYSNPIVVYINSFAQKAMFEYSSALALVYAVLMLVFVGFVYAVVNKFVYYEV